MADKMNESILVDIGQVRLGMYIQLDIGWMLHPFPVNSFRISSPEQLDALRNMGLTQVRCLPSKSDPEAMRQLGATAQTPTPSPQKEDAFALAPEEAATSPDRFTPAAHSALDKQIEELHTCERSFSQATRSYSEITRLVSTQPEQARALGVNLVNGCVDELLHRGDCVIRLLSEDVGVRSGMHPVNVMVLSLLLGRAVGLQSQALRDLGMAALLHDLGKASLPPHVCEPYLHLSSEEMQRYRSHVGASVAWAQLMDLPMTVITAIAQHHEFADGSGFPLRLVQEDLSQHGQMLALVNHYERLCNPSHGGEVLTPHEALSIMFAQYRNKFDAVLLGAFIRMMGVYPPGSVVQLVNDRYAIVISVNPARPLRPRVVVYDPQVAKERALICDLEDFPHWSIRRSLRPTQLPRDALDYLSPRQRVCYFFERAVGLGLGDIGVLGASSAGTGLGGAEVGL